jgi:hypothetical protein
VDACNTLFFLYGTCIFHQVPTRSSATRLITIGDKIVGNHCCCSVQHIVKEEFPAHVRTVRRHQIQTPSWPPLFPAVTQLGSGVPLAARVFGRWWRSRSRIRQLPVLDQPFHPTRARPITPTAQPLQARSSFFFR